MYTSVNSVVEILSIIDLKGLTDKDAIIKIYKELNRIGIVENNEINLLKLWLADAEKLLE